MPAVPASQPAPPAHYCVCCPPTYLPAATSAGSLRKALLRKAFRPSAKWPFQTTYVGACPLPCFPAGPDAGRAAPLHLLLHSSITLLLAACPPPCLAQCAT